MESVRLVDFSAHDDLEETRREPSFARLRRVLDARARDPAGGPKIPLDSARHRD